MLKYCLWLFVSVICVQSNNLNEIEIKDLLQSYETEAKVLCNNLRKSIWNFSTDLGNRQKEAEKVRCNKQINQFYYFIKYYKISIRS